MTTNAKTARAILINPKARTITEIELATSRSDYADADAITYPALRAAVFTDRPHLGYVESMSVGHGVTAWLDEEGLLCDWSEQSFLCLHPPGQPQQGRDLAGNLVLTGINDCGDCVSLPAYITPALVAQTVRWLDPREVVVAAPKLTTFSPDGAATTVDLGGTPTWDFNNQPA